MGFMRCLSVVLMSLLGCLGDVSMAMISIGAAVKW